MTATHSVSADLYYGLMRQSAHRIARPGSYRRRGQKLRAVASESEMVFLRVLLTEGRVEAETYRNAEVRSR